MGVKATPIIKGELSKPNTDPTLLNALSRFDLENSEGVTSQKGTRVNAIVVRVTENMVDERVFSSPFFALTAPSSLKWYLTKSNPPG